MLPDSVSRRPVATTGRLLVTAPLYAVGLGTMVLSLVVWGLFTAGVAAGLGLALLGFVADYLPVTPGITAYLVTGVAFALLGLWAFTGHAWETIRGGLRTEPAAMIARTRRPDPEVEAERPVTETVSRLCQGVDLPAPEVRVREVDRPLCYTVRYPVETPPREVLRENVDVYRAWADDRRAAEGEFVADEPIPADHVLVVSTGLLSTLPGDELAAVLAHEVAHLRNADLALMNALLLPVFWAEAVLEGREVDEMGDLVVAAVQTVLATVTRFVTFLGVVVFARGREFAADRGGAELAGDPAALAAALERLDGATGERPTADLRSVAVANVLPTVDGNRRGILATHPPTERRIERLRDVVEAMEA